MKESISVLLAAFNGSRYIEQQISSILSSKTDVPLSVTVSLDPSSDGTDEILERLKGSLVHVLSNQEPSGGAAQNFSKLADHALTLDDKYYAFSDQDDLWDSDKLAEGLARLRDMEQEYGAGKPLLVFSDSRLVDEDLNIVAPSFMTAESLSPNIINDFRRLTIQNVGQGCTFLFNRALLEIASPIPESARMHDHWFMMVACVFGKIAYLDKTLLSYRQHSSNVLGAGGYGILEAINRAVKKSDSIKNGISKNQLQAECFASRYKNKLKKSEYDFLVEFARLPHKNYIARKIFCVKHRLRMSGFLRTLGLYFYI